MALSISHIIRESMKLVKRKLPVFKETLSTKELRQNPFVCVMMQCGLADGEINEKEQFLIRKVVRAAYSFVDGGVIDDILPKAIDEEARKPTPMGTIVINLKERSAKTPYDAEYQDRLHLITFAFMVAVEDGECRKEEEKYINELAKMLKIADVDVQSIKKTVEKEFTASGSGRVGNLYRNVAKFTLIDIDDLYKDPLFNILIQVAASQDGFISQEEREIIKTILSSIHNISRITINNVFNKAMEKVMENPIPLEKMAEELKDNAGVKTSTLVKIAYFMTIKRAEDGKQNKKDIVEKIKNQLNVSDEEVKDIINEVEDIIKKKRTLEYMKGRDVFNAVNGMYVGNIIDESKDSKEWIVKEPGGLVYGVEKSTVFIREI